jgi:HEAT repeat protein
MSITAVKKLWIALDRVELREILEAREHLIVLGRPIVPELLALLDSGTDRQVANAVIVLGNIAEPQCIEKLIDLLHHHSNLVVRSNAAKALSVFTDPRVAEALIYSLDHESGLVSMGVIAALQQIGGSLVLDVLLHQLKKHRDPEMHYLIIRAIGELGDRSVANQLIPFLDSSDHHTRRETIVALKKLGCEVGASFR